MKRGSFLMLAGALLLLLAAILTTYNLYEDKRAGDISAEVAAILREEISETKQEEMPVIADYEVVPEMEMPAFEIDGEQYIGILSIPELELELPVMKECSEIRLKKAPCAYAGSAYQNDLVIVGHNYRKHFSGLKTLESGAQIYFTDADGNVFRYEIGWTEVLDAEDVEEMLDAKEWDMTLFTCTYGGSNRYAVRCIHVEET